MGKRSNFERRKYDAYQTWDPRPIRHLLPYLYAQGVRSFAEPMQGEGHLVRQLKQAGLACTYAGDIQTGQDVLRLDAAAAGHPDAYVSNPPWTRALMHPIIRHLMRLAPTWLLFDTDWAFNVEAAPLIPHCSHIVPVGRVKWIENSPAVGLDNTAWYRFHIQHRDGPRLMPRRRFTKGGIDDQHAFAAE